MKENFEFLKDFLRQKNREIESRKEELVTENETIKCVEDLVARVEELERKKCTWDEERESLKNEVKSWKGKYEALQMQQKELGQMSQKMAQKADNDVVLAVFQLYINISHQKTAKKRGYIKMLIFEMAASAKITLPESMIRELEHFDDDETGTKTNVIVQPGGINVQSAKYVANE